ncbi:hypothetical protein AV530_007848 [Patagioenas fasciata monilis]|uniref:Uncharacterized protein n=1 Tax=Patagioenas fasciata monilis TaxID=372326 RepID=A0A1V4JT55_PATFA|nr:hypothetical protein AV530_007848 [Patagioenas fasciata monilis]
MQLRIWKVEAHEGKSLGAGHKMGLRSRGVLLWRHQPSLCWRTLCDELISVNVLPVCSPSSVFCGPTEESVPFKKLQKIHSDPHPAKFYSLISALHSKGNYSEEELKIVSRFFFCSLCEISSVPTYPAMHISSSARQYCSTIEPGSSFNWELLKCNATEEVIPISTRR